MKLLSLNIRITDMTRFDHIKVWLTHACEFAAMVVFMVGLFVWLPSVTG